MVYVVPSGTSLSQEKGNGGNEEFDEKVIFVIFVVGVIAVRPPEWIISSPSIWIFLSLSKLNPAPSIPAFIPTVFVIRALGSEEKRIYTVLSVGLWIVTLSNLPHFAIFSNAPLSGVHTVSDERTSGSIRQQPKHHEHCIPYVWIRGKCKDETKKLTFLVVWSKKTDLENSQIFCFSKRDGNTGNQ